MAPPVRTAEERKRDTLHRLQHDVDCWVATADGDSGTPYLAPLSYLWGGCTFLISTPASIHGGSGHGAKRASWKAASLCGMASGSCGIDGLTINVRVAPRGCTIDQFASRATRSRT